MTQAALFIEVTTRNPVDDTADRRRCNLSNPRAVHWLNKHIYNRMHAGYSVHIAPVVAENEQ